jgi:hypothetical protein
VHAEIIIFIYGIYVRKNQLLLVHFDLLKKSKFKIFNLFLQYEYLSTYFRISRCLLPLAFNSKWLLVGTYCGNVYVVNLDTFTLSSYKIMWNNAIGMCV